MPLQTPTFYASWIRRGVKFNQQIGESQHNSATVNPIANATFQDLEDGTDELNTARSIAGFDFGTPTFRNKFRMFYDKDQSPPVWSLRVNRGTVAVPRWVDYLTVRENDGLVTVTEGGFQSQQGFYGTTVFFDPVEVLEPTADNHPVTLGYFEDELRKGFADEVVAGAFYSTEFAEVAYTDKANEFKQAQSADGYIDLVAGTQPGYNAAPDLSQSNYFKIPLAVQSFYLLNPTNIPPAGTYVFEIQQQTESGKGFYDVIWDTKYIFERRQLPVITPIKGAIDIASGVVGSDGNMRMAIVQGFYSIPFST